MGAGPERVDDEKQRSRAMWNTTGAGYHEIALGLLPAVERLLDLLPLRAGTRLLDVACGTGIASHAAAERGADVTGVDFAPDLIAEARRLAAEHGLAERCEFLVGDAEALPFPDASFDVAISTFGAIFATDQQAVAREFGRVLRPGGVLGLAAWKPHGPNLRLMTLLVPFLPPPPVDRPGPFTWGKPENVEQLLGANFDGFEYIEGDVPLVVASVSEAVELLFRRGLGPTTYLFNRFDPPTQLAAHDALIALLRDCVQPDGSVRLGRDFLLVRAVALDGSRG